MNVTVPVGVPPVWETGATFADKVTACWKLEGFKLDVSVVVVFVVAAPTVRLTLIVCLVFVAPKDTRVMVPL